MCVVLLDLLEVFQKMWPNLQHRVSVHPLVAIPHLVHGTHAESRHNKPPPCVSLGIHVQSTLLNRQKYSVESIWPRGRCIIIMDPLNKCFSLPKSGFTIIIPLHNYFKLTIN